MPVLFQNWPITKARIQFHLSIAGFESLQIFTAPWRTAPPNPRASQACCWGRWAGTWTLRLSPVLSPSLASAPLLSDWMLGSVLRVTDSIWHNNWVWSVLVTCFQINLWHLFFPEFFHNSSSFLVTCSVMWLSLKFSFPRKGQLFFDSYGGKISYMNLLKSKQVNHSPNMEGA